MKRTKVRFSLQKGDNYMKWRIIYPDGSVKYFNPDEVQLIMRGCTLKNNKKAATKIFNGETTKVVCAWIMCESVQVTYPSMGIAPYGVSYDVMNMLKGNLGATPYKVSYNPRKEPNWVIGEENADNTFREIIYSVGKELLLVEP
jgi:hypothetical protein